VIFIEIIPQLDNVFANSVAGVRNALVLVGTMDTRKRIAVFCLGPHSL
jgi:hypothetical protein